MAATQALERLKGLLECSVCLEQYEDPKMLLCTHEFCKVCIESIADFHEDGSAVIKCPMRCAEMTKLSTTQTVGHLAASYNFKNVLEALSDDVGGGNGGCGDGSGKFQVPGCSYVDGCGKPLSVYTSYNVMCSSCYENLSDLQTALDKINSTEHAPINSKVRVPICYNKKENKLMFLCEEHKTFCTDFCTEDNTLLCFIVNIEKLLTSRIRKRPYRMRLTSLRKPYRWSWIYGEERMRLNRQQSGAYKIRGRNCATY